MWALRCVRHGLSPGEGYGAQIAPDSNAVSSASFSILKRLYRTPPPPEKALLKTERNKLIRERHAIGETLEHLASEFGISFQRVHQIVHQRYH